MLQTVPIIPPLARTVTPFEIGDVVRSNLESNLPGIELQTARVYRVDMRQQRPMYPGGRVVWFYQLTGHKKCNVYHEFLRKVEGTAKPT